MSSSRGRILVLGGTAEARELAIGLAKAEVPAVTSLAGRLAEPRLPSGEVRVGGFGGSEALARWLTDQDIAAVVDATHPFATRISASALSASTAAGVPVLRLGRPGWGEQPGDRWHWTDDLHGAAALVPSLGARALLTIGRQEVSAFAGIAAVWFLIRCIEPPAPPLPLHHALLLERGPFSRAGELALLEHHGIDVLVTKDSGGRSTEAKLDAARERQLPVIVVRRPPGLDVRTVPDVAGALAWIDATLSL